MVCLQLRGGLFFGVFVCFWPLLLGIRPVYVGVFLASLMNCACLSKKKFCVLGSGMRRYILSNPTSLTFRLLCFIKFQIYPADMETLNVVDMETVKGYPGKRKGTKHRIIVFPFTTILGFDFHDSFK